jgi:biopolymer transport protein TolR
MAITSGNSHGISNEMNVTPLIDVLLVLLIIFMVLTPMTPEGLGALVPQAPSSSSPPIPMPRTIVVQVLHGDADQPTRLKINEEDATWENVENRLHAIFANRVEKVVFIKGDENVTFDSIAQIIDRAHGAGVDKVGLLTAKIETGR